MVKLTIYLTERQYAELKQLSALTGLGFAEALRQCLEPGLAEALRHEQERKNYTDPGPSGDQRSVGSSPKAKTGNL